jgi:hypothetical protein
MPSTRTLPLRLRRSLALGATALAIGGVAAETASAAGPVILPSGAETMFPTWFGGTTTVCSRNLSGANGLVRVTPFPYVLSNYIYTNPFGERCTRGSWWGNPVKVINQSSGTEVVRSY